MCNVTHIRKIVVLIYEKNANTLIERKNTIIIQAKHPGTSKQYVAFFFSKKNYVGLILE